MTDLNALLKDFFDNRLSYKQVYREKFEALLSAMVAEATAQTIVIDKLGADLAAMAAEIEALKAAKRGPGRPPKEAE